MRYILQILLLAVFVNAGGPGMIFRANADSVNQPTLDFESANKLYEQGEYAQAAEAYESLIKEGPITEALLFNCGVAYWKNGQTGLALWRLRQAKALNPSDNDISSNLRIIRTELGRSPIDGDLTLALEKLANWLAPGSWALLSLALCWLIAGWLGWIYGIRRSSFRGSFSISITLLFLFLIALGASRLGWSSRGTPADVVFLINDSPLRFGPLNESKVASRIREGMEAVVIDKKGDWALVETESGVSGWTSLGNLGFVFPDSSLSNESQVGASVAPIESK